MLEILKAYQAFIQVGPVAAKQCFGQRHTMASVAQQPFLWVQGRCSSTRWSLSVLSQYILVICSHY